MGLPHVDIAQVCSHSCYMMAGGKIDLHSSVTVYQRRGISLLTQGGGIY